MNGKLTKGCFGALLWSLFAVGAMAQPQASYYTASTLDGKNGRALELALQAIVYPHTAIGYDHLWTAYETTDLAPADSIPVDYTGDYSMLVYDMYAWMQYFPKFYEEAIVDKESAHSQTGGINREHCVPNSWWGGKSGNAVAYTDLHHLFPADGAANNAKQNYPLGEYVSGLTLSFPTNTGTYNGRTYVTPENACSHVWTVPAAQSSAFGGASKVFEPADMYKGDFARAYLYVVCAYENKVTWQTTENTMFTNNTSDNNYTDIAPWALNLLLRWHRNDPVSEKEKVRNNAVESIQHNRNPFIDYPELVEYIWGNKSSQSFSLSGAQCSYNSVYYDITPSAQMTGGSVVASPAAALAGETVTLYATADETHVFNNIAANWSVRSGSTPVAIMVGEGNSCTFIMPAADVTVAAVFDDNPNANHYIFREDFSSVTAGNNDDTNGSSSQWTKSNNFSAASYVYQAGEAVKLGKNSDAGSITTKTLDLSQNGGRFMLSFDVKGWTTVEGDITVTITGMDPVTYTYSATMSGEFETIEQVFEGGQANSTITIATTAKRAFIDNIRVYYFRGMQEIELSSVGWCTYSTDKAFLMPAGLTGYTVTYADGALSMTATYPEGEVVPAGEALLIRGEQGVYPYSVCTSSEESIAGFLHPHLRGGTISAVAGATYYYKLLKPAGEPLGWYWGEPNGGLFNLGANKAYLALPAGAATAPAFILLEDEEHSATGIINLTEWQNGEAERPNMQGTNSVDWRLPAYNILGQPVSKGYKGIVLQGGKKFLAR